LFIPEDWTSAEQRANNVLFVFALIIAPVFYLAGLIPGIIGVFMKDSKKIFAVLGIVLSSLPLVLVAAGWVLIKCLSSYRFGRRLDVI